MMSEKISWKKLVLIFLFGFSSGLPFLLTGGTLKLWLTRENLDISTIGYFSWVTVAYSLKFLWAPLLDHYSLLSIGRRRSWILFTQILLVIGLLTLGSLDPHFNLYQIAAVCVLVAFFSATQDTAIDAYRREILSTPQLALGSSIHNGAYRIAVLVSGGLGIGFVGSGGAFDITFNQLYFVMAGFMAIGIIATIFAPEPEVTVQKNEGLLRGVIDPFKEFLQRDGALVILAFVFLFKLGDALSGSMLNTYYAKVGYSNADIGYIAKIFGMSSGFVGLFLGSAIIYRIGIGRALWIFGILQALSTAAFSLLHFTGPEKWALALTVVFEDITAGMGSAAFLAFLSALTNRKYTATQYAILASIATAGRNIFSGFSGVLVERLGWPNFFYTCGLIAIPGLLLIIQMRKYQTEQE